MAHVQTIEIDPAWIPLAMLPRMADGYRVRWTRRERAILRRKDFIRPSVWAEQHIVIPDDSAEPGQYRNSVTPYAAGIMDASFYPGVQEIVICAPSQTGKTTVVNNCLAYAMDRVPGNAIVVYPDEVTAKDNAKDRLLKMIDASPLLRGFKTGLADDEASVKIRLKNMILYMAWANSASRLANRPAPYGVADEEDKYPATAGKKESAPIDLLRNRARTFRHMRKLWRVSTPTVETGAIWTALTVEAEAVFDFWVACPDCGVLQDMDFKAIKWDGRGEADPERVESEKLAWYECPHCQSKWDDMKRNIAARDGQWRDRESGAVLEAALRERKPRVIGFHLRAWFSPFVSLSESAAAFLRGLKSLNKMKKFQNDHAAEPWRVSLKKRSEDRIMALVDDRPRGMVPGGDRVACLLAGVDTQDDGFWYEIRAFGYGATRESWGVREGKAPTFEALELILWDDQYKSASGGVYPVQLVVQDSAGHRTSEVYDFCRRHRGRILPSIGRQTMAKPFTFSPVEYYPSSKKPIPGGLVLYSVHTNYYKNQLASILEIEPGDPGAWLYHSEITEDWAKQMTAEGINEQGLWENPYGRPNHAWDCSVLLLVAHDVLGVQYWPRPGEARPTHKPKKGAVIEKRKRW
jgi:phage terminase large subunit GpA-like protein